MHWIKRHIALLFFFTVFVIGVVLSPRVGVSWDEADNIFAGGVYVTFFKENFNPHAFDGFWDQASYFRDRIFTLNPTLSHYPPVANYVGSALSIVAEQFGYGKTGPEIIILFHVATAIFLAILTATVYRFALLLGLTPITSLFVAAATYLYPTIFGHGLTNLKDTAQTAMFTLSLYYLVKNKLWVGAIFWGLALATKFNAIYVPIVWVLWRFLSGISDKKKVIVDTIFVVLIGLTVMFVVWPYVWFDPMRRIMEVISYFTTVGQGYSVYWYGHIYTVGERSTLWWYPWMSVLTMTPPILLLLGITGVIRIFWKRDVKNMLLVVWFLVPMARTILPYAAFYDGLRHFMEVIPALALLCGVGIEAVGRRAYPMLLGGIVGYLVLINYMYFPYSTGYLNIFAENPNMNADRDIEGLSVKEGIDWLHKTYGDVTVWIPIAEHNGWVYIREGRDQIVRNQSMGNFVIVVNKLSHWAKFPEFKTFPAIQGFVLDHVISRGNAVFGWVYRRPTVAR